MHDIFIAILYDIGIGIITDEVRELIEKLLSGQMDDPFALIAGGSAGAFAQVAADHGIDLATLSPNEWQEFAEAFLAAA